MIGNEISLKLRKINPDKVKTIMNLDKTQLDKIRLIKDRQRPIWIRSD